MKDVIETVFYGGTVGGAVKSRHALPHLVQWQNDDANNFFRRSQSTISFSGQLSCSVLSSADTFLLELETIPPLEIYAEIEDQDTMTFMEEIAKEL